MTPLIVESKIRKESQEDVGILILGDSADRNLAFDTCLSAAREVGLPSAATSMHAAIGHHSQAVSCYGRWHARENI